MITISSLFNFSKGINCSPEVLLMNCTPRFCRSLLTWGLWIISDKRNIRLSGFSSSAWYAISMAFSTPKQKPKCLAILKQTDPKFNVEGDRSRLRGSVMRRACLITEIIGLRKKCGTSNVRDKLSTPKITDVGFWGDFTRLVLFAPSLVVGTIFCGRVDPTCACENQIYFSVSGGSVGMFSSPSSLLSGFNVIPLCETHFIVWHLITFCQVFWVAENEIMMI